MKDWNSYIFSDAPFEEKARIVFDYQMEQNAVYRRYCEALGLGTPNRISDIPLLPVRGFKDAKITTGPEAEQEVIFQSSGTSGMDKSTHHVADAELYRKSILKGFNHFYDLDQSVILAYTPGYSGNPHSSLVWMLKALIEQDDSGLSGFLPLEEALDQSTVDRVEQSGRRLVLFGAAFGLIDLVDKSSLSLPNNSTVIETGGMKTHRREMGRQAMHRLLADGFDLANDRIHSEYGMTELLSQCYATGGKWFRSVPWMQVSIRDPKNPMKELPPYYEGLIGIIDLANVYSCAFVLTGDKGMMDRKGRFQVLGRWNPKDLRGCNFLIDQD